MTLAIAYPKAHSLVGMYQQQPQPMRHHSVCDTEWTRKAPPINQDRPDRKFTTVGFIAHSPTTNCQVNNDEKSVGIIATNISQHSGTVFINQLDAMYERDIDSVFSHYLSSGCILNYNQLTERSSSPASQRRMHSTDICLIPFYCESYDSFLGAQQTRIWLDSVQPNMKSIFVGVGKSAANKADLAYLDIKCAEMNYALEMIDDIGNDFSEQLTQRIRAELDIRAVNKLQQHKIDASGAQSHQYAHSSGAGPSSSTTAAISTSPAAATAASEERTSRLTKLRNLFARKSSSGKKSSGSGELK